MVDTSKTLWVKIGCYDGYRWDAMGRTKTFWLSKTLWVEIGCYDGCRWDAMGRTKTLWVTHLRHCGWR